MNNLAFLLKSDNKLEESEVLYKEVLEVEIEVLGEQHPSVIVARSNIGMLLKTLNRFDEAEDQYRVALENATVALGRSNLTTIATINNLASVLFMVSKLAESEALLREVVVLQTERAGTDSADAIKAKRNLDEVIEYAKTKAVEEEGPKIDLPTIMGKIQQSMEMRAKGFPQGAEPLMQESLQGLRDIVGSKHEHTIKFAADLASVFKDLGKLAEAKVLLTEVCASAQETLGPDHASTAEYMEALQTLEQLVPSPS
jgi:tetratricopeptide (TPR) repeat protein